MGMTQAINVTVDSAHLVSPNPKPSKQLNYYYRHKLERLAYQRTYYNKHKPTILSNKHYHDYLIKVKRTENNISLLRKMRVESYSLLKKKVESASHFYDAFFHVHGRPNFKRRNSRYCLPETRMWLHAIPELERAKELTLQTAHFLGLKLGDSLVWRELNRFTHKVELHTVCFDGSGLDISHESNLPCLVACCIETGLKGLNLLRNFALKYSLNGYIQAWRGNKLLLTSERENALKVYLKKENLLEYYSEMKNVINDYPRETVNFPELT